jgi:high-affinity Fe2+/Pb2+ permease
MGANSTQALAVIVFLIAFTVMAGAFAMGGNWPLLILSFVILVVAAGIFLKAKPWEEIEE